MPAGRRGGARADVALAGRSGAAPSTVTVPRSADSEGHAVGEAAGSMEGGGSNRLGEPELCPPQAGKGLIQAPRRAAHSSEARVGGPVAGSWCAGRPGKSP